MKTILLISAGRGANGHISATRAFVNFLVKRVAMILMAILLPAQFASAQKIDTSAASPQATHGSYIQKYKTSKTVAWLLLAPGATAATIRGVVNVRNGNGFFKYGFTPRRGPALGLIGSIMALSSFPFFISAGNSRKKAFLSLKRDKVVSAESGPGNFHYLAIDLKIRF